MKRPPSAAHAAAEADSPTLHQPCVECDSIDPATEEKRFAARAAQASDRIVGKGYSVLTETALTTLPELPPGAVFNAEEQAKYRREAQQTLAPYLFD